jgi:hypothetical protein
MRLIDFPYTTTKGIAKYSKLVTKAIFLIGRIYVDPDSSISKGEDRLGYWDADHEDICFGRYLLFKNPENERIKFWMGLHSTSGNTNLIVWFKKADPFTKYAQKLQDIFDARFKSTNHDIGLSEEAWVLMDDKEFVAFCDGNTSCKKRKDILKNFLSSVLRVLN